jgi:hypothetical protein
MIAPYPYDVEINQTKLFGGRTGMQSWELQWIVWTIRYRTKGNIVEIGTHFGDTARELALQFPDRRIHCVDVCSPEYPVITPETVCRAAKSLPNVTLHLQDSKTFVYRPDYNISIIIVDGDHSWEGVRADTELALAYAKGRHGTIIWHDCYLGCQVFDYLNWLYDHGMCSINHVVATSLAFYPF